MSDDVVWSGTVDNGEWLAKVVWVSEYAGRLTVTNVSDGRVVLDEQVGLSYGALFGPDVADIMDWQDMTIRAIDNA